MPTVGAGRSRRGTRAARWSGDDLTGGVDDGERTDDDAVGQRRAGRTDTTLQAGGDGPGAGADAPIATVPARAAAQAR